MLFTTIFPVLTYRWLFVSSQPSLATDICNMCNCHTKVSNYLEFVHWCIGNNVTTLQHWASS